MASDWYHTGAKMTIEWYDIISREIITMFTSSSADTLYVYLLKLLLLVLLVMLLLAIIEFCKNCLRFIFQISDMAISIILDAVVFVIALFVICSPFVLIGYAALKAYDYAVDNNFEDVVSQ